MEELPGFIYIHTANGKLRRWRLVWLPKKHPLLEGGVGRIEAPGTKDKRLFLQIGQHPDDLFDTMLHEIAHGAGWNLTEEWVTDFAVDVTRTMKKLGYEFKRIR